MKNKIEEWLRQSEYDMNTAEYMYNGERFFYSVFMCHLSIEKALKGLFFFKLQEIPPKTHNLIYLLSKIAIKPDEKIGKIIAKLNEASISTRYPDDMDELQKNFTRETAKEILSQAKETLVWIKKQF